MVSETHNRDFPPFCNPFPDVPINVFGEYADLWLTIFYSVTMKVHLTLSVRTWTHVYWLWSLAFGSCSLGARAILFQWIPFRRTWNGLFLFVDSVFCCIVLGSLKLVILPLPLECSALNPRYSGQDAWVIAFSEGERLASFKVSAVRLMQAPLQSTIPAPAWALPCLFQSPSKHPLHASDSNTASSHTPHAEYGKMAQDFYLL